MTEQSSNSCFFEQRMALIILLMACAIHIVLTLPFIMSFPPVDYAADESWMLSIAESLAHQGTHLAPMHAGTPLATRPQIVSLWLYSGALAAVVKVAGASLFWARMLSWISGSGALFFTYFLAKAMAGRLAGAAAVLLLSANIAFSLQSRMVRPETMLICITLAAVFYYHRAITEQDGRLELFLAGLLATLSVEVHPNGSIIAVSLLVAYPFLNRKRIYGLRTVTFLAGLASGTLIWVCANWLPFNTDSFGNVHNKYLPPLLTDGVVSTFAKASAYLVELLSPAEWDTFTGFYLSGLQPWVPYLFIVLPVMLGLIFTTMRRNLCLLAGLVAMAQFVAFLIVGEWGNGHPVIFAPYAAIAVAVSLAGMTRKLQKRSELVFPAALAILAAPFIADVAARDMKYSVYNPSEIHSAVAQVIPADASYLGSGFHYFMRGKGSPLYISPLSLEGNCPDFEQMVNRVGADYVIVDKALLVLAATWCGESYLQSITDFSGSNRTIYSGRIDYPTYYGGNLDFVNVIRVVRQRE